MSQVKVLNQTAIKSVMEMDRVIQSVEAAYIGKAKKQAEVWPMVFHEFEPETAELDIKSGNMVPESIYGLKLVSWFEET